MQRAQEPTAGEFFASSSGVCVYINLGGRAFRVEFSSVDSEGVAPGATGDGVEAAIVAAAAALQRHKLELEPLFARVTTETASRAGRS
jgi:hypothetical protein